MYQAQSDPLSSNGADTSGIWLLPSLPKGEKCSLFTSPHKAILQNNFQLPPEIISIISSYLLYCDEKSLKNTSNLEYVEEDESKTEYILHLAKLSSESRDSKLDNFFKKIFAALCFGIFLIFSVLATRSSDPKSPVRYPLLTIISLKK